MACVPMTLISALARGVGATLLAGVLAVAVVVGSETFSGIVSVRPV
jgi:hypothetical protein